MRRIKLQRDSKGNDNVYRLFIDPASISSGWALFLGKELVKSGTIATDKKLSVFHRLLNLYLAYRTLVLTQVEEVHVEQLPRRCHIYTHWSVAVIGLALTKFTLNIAGDIPVKSWQKYVGWGDKELMWQVEGCDSEDELAAVCMGRWYVGTKI